MRSAPRDDAPRVLISHSVHVLPGASGRSPSRLPKRSPQAAVGVDIKSDVLFGGVCAVLLYLCGVGLCRFGGGIVGWAVRRRGDEDGGGAVSAADDADICSLLSGQERKDEQRRQNYYR